MGLQQDGTDSAHEGGRFGGPELCGLFAREVVALLRAGEVSPKEVLEASLARIAAVEPLVNALPTLCPERALAEIDRLPDRRTRAGTHPGWLAGLPLAIKDLTPVAGVRTTFGTRGLGAFIPEESDPTVLRLEARGGIVVAKSNTPEMGAGGNTFNDVFGATRNPHDTRFNAGGSSGGAAAALACGEVWLAHGSDLGGSLRTPAAYCGIVGLRPSPGLCGGGPDAAAFLIEGTDGPMARDIGDLALFLDAMAGYDPRDPIGFEPPVTPYQRALDTADRRLRFAFSEDLNGFAPVAPEMRAALGRAMAAIARAGHVVEEASPDVTGLDETFRTLRGVLYGSGPAAAPETVSRHFKPALRQNIAEGLALSSGDIYRANRQRTTLYHTMRRFLETHHVLALPVVGLDPLPLEIEYPIEVAGEPTRDYLDWLRFSYLATVCALPALSVPVGRSASGLPVGLQLIGPPRGEALLLQAGLAVERAIGLSGRPIDPIVA